MSLLLSKARFISEQFIYYLRALSNQTVPYQALTKIKKRATTKIEKVKVIQLLASSHPQKVVFPSPRPNWPLSLSLAINCQCLLHWTNHLAAKLNAVAKLNVFNPPGLLEEKISRPPLTPPPPRAPPAGFSPPLLLPLSSGSCRAGVPPILKSKKWETWICHCKTEVNHHN